MTTLVRCTVCLLVGATLSAVSFPALAYCNDPPAIVAGGTARTVLLATPATTSGVSISEEYLSFHGPTPELGDQRPIEIWERAGCTLPISSPQATQVASIPETEASISHDLFTRADENFHVIHDSQQSKLVEGLGTETLVFTSERWIWRTSTVSFGSGALEVGASCGVDLAPEQPATDRWSGSERWVFSRGGNIFLCDGTPCPAAYQVQLTDEEEYWDHEPRLFMDYVVWTRRTGPGLHDTNVMLTDLTTGIEQTIATHARRPDVYGTWVAYEQWVIDPGTCSFSDGAHHTQLHVFGPLDGNPQAAPAWAGLPQDPDYWGHYHFERPRLTTGGLAFIAVDRTQFKDLLLWLPVPQQGPWVYTQVMREFDDAGSRHHAFDIWQDGQNVSAAVYVNASEELTYTCFEHP